MQQWFADHVTLNGQPYTLDLDQARAVSDTHKNTLVIARAGSGKTRVIVAKVAYLVAALGYHLDEIAIFMFNRTAAAEVNARIADVKVDGISLGHFEDHSSQPAAKMLNREKSSQADTVTIASTFHKFALNVVKLQGENPAIISETDQNELIEAAIFESLKSHHLRPSPKLYQEIRQIVSSFIVRAGQKFPGAAGLQELDAAVQNYIDIHQDDPAYEQKIMLHRLSAQAFKLYLQHLSVPETDFNSLMTMATEILRDQPAPAIQRKISQLRYIMIDEYQDFSYLFYALTLAIRFLAPEAHLFAVGDDWQAINRFAGSDVDYFLHFVNYFPEDATTIPLATNYRSCRKIVEYANRYMLRNYDPQAIPAQAFNRQSGKIRSLSLQRLKFRTDDWQEDGAGDARFEDALLEMCNLSSTSSNRRNLLPATKLLKQLVKLFRRHANSEIMLLHRHNFLSCSGVTLEQLNLALKQLVLTEGIMSAEAYERQVRVMTMHKSKGLEAEVVMLLEMDPEVIFSHHPHGTIFELFGDTLAAETADQQRLIYVALTRAKQRLYLISADKNPL